MEQNYPLRLTPHINEMIDRAVDSERARIRKVVEGLKSEVELIWDDAADSIRCDYLIPKLQAILDILKE